MHSSFNLDHLKDQGAFLLQFNLLQGKSRVDCASKDSLYPTVPISVPAESFGQWGNCT